MCVLLNEDMKIYLVRVWYWFTEMKIYLVHECYWFKSQNAKITTHIVSLEHIFSLLIYDSQIMNYEKYNKYLKYSAKCIFTLQCELKYKMCTFTFTSKVCFKWNLNIPEKASCDHRVNHRQSIPSRQGLLFCKPPPGGWTSRVWDSLLVMKSGCAGGCGFAPRPRQ